MAVRLRLRRIGKKKQPMYKIVAADSRSPRDGKFLEAVGLYNPLTNPHTVDIKEDRIQYWLNNGAQPTDTVNSLLRQKGITIKRHLAKKGLSEEKIHEELENWSKLQEAKSKVKSSKKIKKSKAAGKSGDTENQQARPEEEAKEIKESTTEAKGAASGEDSTGDKS